MSMSERFRLERREFMREYEAQEKEKAEERMRPVKELEEKNKKLLKEVYEVERENVSLGQDASAYVSPRLYERMPADQVESFNKEASERFVRDHPDYYACPENREALISYLQRQKVDKFFDYDTLAAAYKRLKSFGLLKEKPVPPPPPPDPKPAPKPVEAPKLTKPQMTLGHDPTTGKERAYSDREIALMSSDEYRRVFFKTGRGLTKDALILCKRTW